jgi:hypothetical protein
MIWNNTWGWTYANRYNLSFYKWKEVAPYFKVTKFYPEKSDEWEATFVIGNFKWVFFREDIQIEWARALFDEAKIILEDWDNQYCIQMRLDNITRFALNQLMSINVWQEIKISTYINWNWYKTMQINNPNERITITTKKWKQMEVDKSFELWIPFAEVPPVDVTKDKKWVTVSVDDSEANKFIINAVKSRFELQQLASDKTTEQELDIKDLPF